MLTVEQKYEKLFRFVDDFTYEHDFSFIFESEWKLRMLFLLFPSVTKSLSKLIYDLDTLKKLLNELAEDKVDNLDAGRNYNA